jgi:hypothetical protein
MQNENLKMQNAKCRDARSGGNRVSFRGQSNI